MPRSIRTGWCTILRRERLAAGINSVAVSEQAARRVTCAFADSQAFIVGRARGMQIKEDGDPGHCQPPDSLGEAFRRGLSLRCPLCGGGKLFTGLISMESSCGRCGFRYERGPGYFLGSTYINYGLTTLLTTWTYIIGRFVLEIDQRTMIPGIVAFCVTFPVVFFRYARSLWLSLDCYFDKEGAVEGLAPEGQESVKKTFKDF